MADLNGNGVRVPGWAFSPITAIVIALLGAIVSLSISLSQVGHLTAQIGELKAEQKDMRKDLFEVQIEQARTRLPPFDPYGNSSPSQPPESHGR